MEAAIFWLSIIGNITSIIGFGITISVWIGVNSLRKIFVSRATIPHQLETLSGLRERIVNELSGQFTKDNRNKIFEILAEATANINNMSTKLKLLNKRQYKSLIEPTIEAYKNADNLFSSNPNKETARTISLKLLELVRTVQLFVEDDSWRRIQ